jgi:hypothetical protein
VRLGFGQINHKHRAQTPCMMRAMNKVAAHSLTSDAETLVRLSSGSSPATLECRWCGNPSAHSATALFADNQLAQAIDVASFPLECLRIAVFLLCLPSNDGER